MTSSDFLALLPLLISTYAGVAVMCIVPFIRSPRLAIRVTQGLLAAAFASVFVALPYAPRNVTTLIHVDAFSLTMSAVILATASMILLYSGDYMKRHEKGAEAFCILLSFSVSGMLVIVSSAHFASFFLGLEALSVSLYGLIGYTRRNSISLEAAIKYLIMAAVSSAFLLFGIALIYADLGVMDFRRLLSGMVGGHISTLTYLGLGFVLVGFGFKLAWAPFHTWSPDVYQGAPAPVTALIASGSKGAVFALFLRLMTLGDLSRHRPIFIAIAVVATATMFVGNLLALNQRNIKRILAYSSVAQMGYLLVPLLSGGARGVSSSVFYLIVYLAATVAAFGVISIVSSSREMGDADRLENYSGLASRRPWLAGVLAVAILSLVGMPLTAGFFAKFYIFSAAAEAGLWWLLIVGVVNTGMSAFYYLRIIFTLYSPERTSDSEVEVKAWPAISLAIASAIIIFAGIYPAPVVRLAQFAARAVGL